jgi:hypothetical protein
VIEKGPDRELMDNSRVSDIRLLESEGELVAKRDGRLARFLGEIVAAGSLLPSGEFQLSGLLCRRRPQRRPCGGKIRLGREPSTDEIHWCCESCGDHGVVTNWQRTRWDLQPELQDGRIVSLSLERARRSRPLQSVRQQSYELSVELVHAPMLLEERVIRHVELTGDHTLQDLHACLHGAFERHDEHPYEFMFGPPYDPETRRFSGPGSATDEGEGFWDTRLVRVDSLGLRAGDAFGYLYDFNDEWVHRITVLGVREASQRIAPRVVERLGTSPAWPPDGEDGQRWQEIESTCPMSSLYGPYLAEEAPEPSDWLALDELERQLLVMEAHARALPVGHPPTGSRLLHALVHSLAETHLCERAGDAAIDEMRCAPQATRHALIHLLGARLIRQQLDANAETITPLRDGAKLGARKNSSKEPH